MFEITIKADSMAELGAHLQLMAMQFQTTPAITPATKPVSKPKAKAPDPQPEPEVDDELTGEDALDAPADPMPEGADAVVDAGTGQPLPKTKAEGDDAPIKMTMDDVKTAAAKLAAKDTPKLAELLKKYGADKLSAVPKAKLGDFAADVMEALG